MSEEKQLSAFEILRSYDVDGLKQKKGKLDYISWSVAWELVLRHDADANFEDHEPTYFADGSCMVSVSVTMMGKTMKCRLPVLDYKNNVVISPNAFQMNTAYQRCLAKAIALHGLGLSLYQNEDIDFLTSSENQSNAPDPMELKKWWKAVIADMNEMQNLDDLNLFMNGVREHEYAKHLDAEQKNLIKEQKENLEARLRDKGV